MLRALIVVGIMALSEGAVPAQSEQADICPVHHIHMGAQDGLGDGWPHPPVGGPAYIAAMNGLSVRCRVCDWRLRRSCWPEERTGLYLSEVQASTLRVGREAPKKSRVGRYPCRPARTIRRYNQAVQLTAGRYAFTFNMTRLVGCSSASLSSAVAELGSR